MCKFVDWIHEVLIGNEDYYDEYYHDDYYGYY